VAFVLRRLEKDDDRYQAERRCRTVTEVVLQAIATEAYIDKVRGEGSKVLVEDSRGRIWEVVFP